MITWAFNDGGRKAAGFKGTTGDCVVRAIAIATSMPYQTVYDDLAVRSKARTRLDSHPRTGVDKRIIKEYLTALGWTWTPTMAIGQGCKVHLRADELPAGRLVVSLSRHMVAVINGVVHDTYDPAREGNRCVYGFWRKV